MYLAVRENIVSRCCILVSKIGTKLGGKMVSDKLIHECLGIVPGLIQELTGVIDSVLGCSSFL